MAFFQLAFLNVFMPGVLQGYRVSPEVREALLLNLVDESTTTSLLLVDESSRCCPLLALVVCLEQEMREEVR